MHDEKIKRQISRIYAHCQFFWPDEFSAIFLSNRETFRDWLNKKLNMNEDHIKNKTVAIEKWLHVLQKMRVEEIPQN